MLYFEKDFLNFWQLLFIWGKNLRFVSNITVLMSTSFRNQILAAKTLATQMTRDTNYCYSLKMCLLHVYIYCDQ